MTGKKIPLLEMKEWLENCIRDGRARGFSNEDIILALHEAVEAVLLEIIMKKKGKK